MTAAGKDPPLFLLFNIQSVKEIIIGALIYFSQLYDHACTDVQFAGFIFCVGSASDIAATPLQFGTQLFLRKAGSIPQSAQIRSNKSITSDFLFHNITPVTFLTSIGCNYRYFMLSSYQILTVILVRLYWDDNTDMIIDFVSNNYISLESVMERIKVADCEDLADVVQAVVDRYREHFPDWEVQFLALPKEKELQIEYLQKMLAMISALDEW